MTITDHRLDQPGTDTQIIDVEPVQTSPQTIAASMPTAAASAGTKPASGQTSFDTRRTRAAGSDLPADHTATGTQCGDVGGDDGSTPLSAIECTSPNTSSLAGDQTDRLDQSDSGNHRRIVEPVTTSLRANVITTPEDPPPAGDHTPAPTIVFPIPRAGASGRAEAGQDRPATFPASPIPRPLADPVLALAADVLDDLERVRIANANRLRILTTTEPDEDGVLRGFGLNETHPDVARLAAMVDTLGRLEHEATLNLQRALRRHPLGSWVKTQKGVGEKQAARLLATIGDPYWNTLYDRPRTVSELWAYCGLHVLPVGHRPSDAHGRLADGDQSSVGGDQGTVDAQSPGVAARRRKGQRANWSTTAKTRAYLIAESMLRASNRDTYDKRKAHTEGRTHAAPCVRCGPKGNPAPVGSPWSDGHRHADALRITSKALLRDLWVEARRIHGGGDEE